jgi:P4 family phage/plasmid primase-like protien
MLKKDNKEKFIQIHKKLKIKKLIMEKKNYFPDNQLQIDNIISNNNLHHINLLDKFCPIIKGEHNKRYMYIEINKFGQIVLKCYCQSCRGKEYPENDILMLNKEEIKTIFNFNQNNYITINNNFTDIINTNEICSEIIKIDHNAQIFENDELNKLIIESLTGSDAKFAKVIFYLFKNHRWIENEYIHTYISDGFVNYYYKIILFIQNSKDITKNEKITSIREIKKIIKVLETNTRKANIIDELGRRIRDEYPNFFDILDTKPFIIGFNNGVYDLNEMKFRNGEPEDMISMSCNYNFSYEYSEKKQELINFLCEILPNKDDREYFLTYLSSCLTGLNMSELFTILTGKGRNGKSKLIELISLTLGDYMGRPKCKLLTGNRPDENSPEPGLLFLKKKRIIMVSEPEIGDKLNSGFIKMITGNDSIYLRKCHNNDMEIFKPNFITFLACNQIPNIDNMDYAFAKRLRCINFPTEFVENPSKPHHKKVDTTLQEKILYWKNDFMLLLIEYYSKYKKQQLIPTNNILEWTNMYKEEVDLYFNFLNDCTEEAKTHISNVQLYKTFKLWFQNNYGNDKIPNNRVFITGIRKYKTIEKSVLVDKNITSGIKNLKIKNIFINDN